MKSKYLYLKTAALGIIMSFAASSYAGMMDDMFNSNYDPYYGRLASQSSGCYRPCVETLDRCDCACNVDECKCVRSVTTFENRMPDAPYQDRRELEVNVFDGLF